MLSDRVGPTAVLILDPLRLPAWLECLQGDATTRSALVMTALEQADRECATLDALNLRYVRQRRAAGVALLAEQDLLEGRGEQAQAHIQALDQTQWLYARFDYPLPVVWSYLETGAKGEAEALLADVIPLAQAQDNWLQMMNAQRAQALLASRRGRWDEAERHLEAALDLCHRMPYPYGEAKTLNQWGQLHAALGAPRQARAKYQAALSICERLGEGLYRPHIECALAELGVE
jgi:tetratricopeptide (TPR) repeat protein